jgi:hypothetical protein
VTNLFGCTTISKYDPDDEPGPFGLSFNKLKELVECNPDEGWAKRKSDSSSARAGDLLPFRTSINGAKSYIHHIIWVFAHDGNWCWPPDEIDHKDGNRKNRTISNLRKATRSQQQMNQKLPSDNSSGYIGIYRNKKQQKWCAQITIDQRIIYLGSFDYIEDAVNARHILRNLLRVIRDN